MNTKLLVLLLSVIGVIHAAPERIGFTGTYGLGRTEDLPTRVLDHSVMVLPLVTIEYPNVMRASGTTDSVGATVWVEPDGHVSRVIVTHGSDIRLQEPTQKAIVGWRFSPPMKDARPVAALIRIKISFADSRITEIVVLNPEEPNRVAGGN